MKNKVDVYEILNKNETDNQEQQTAAPDFDLFNVKDLLSEPETMSKTVPEKVQEAEKNARRSPAVRTLSKVIILAAAVILILTFVIAVTKVTVDSMDPLISKGDCIVANRHARSYKTGDIIVFKDQNGRKLVARIVARDGDVVSVSKKGNLIINDNAQEEDSISKDASVTDASVSYPVIVGAESYFVLGDNHENSLDSRSVTIGLVESGDIVGKVIFCFKKI